MPGPRHASPLVTEEEFLELPESLDRVELLDGEVIVSPSPTDEHQRLLSEVLVELVLWARQHPPAEVRPAPLDIRFGAGRILQPDLALWLAGLPRPAPTPIDRRPDLVVEVVSGRRSYDRITKRSVYGDAGVPEYWIVDPARSLVEVVRSEATAEAEQTLTSALLPGFALDLRRLFAPA